MRNVHHDQPNETLMGGDPSAYTVPYYVKVPDMKEDDENHHTIKKWYKKPGEVIKKNDTLFDFVTPSFLSSCALRLDDEQDAVMGEIYVQEGSTAKENDLICTIYHLPEKGKDVKE